MVESLHLGVVPMGLVVGDDVFRDGEVDPEALLARTDQRVSTSAPTPGDVAKVLEDGLATADAAVVLTVSSAMSATFDAARLAADAIDAEVRVVDTGTAAGGEGLVAVAAARAAAAGEDLPGVVAAAEDVAERVRLMATVGSLDRLVASGRVPRAAGRAGNAIGVHPLFEFRRGRVRPMRPSLSRGAALDRIVASCRADRPGPGAQLHAMAMHAGDADAVDQLVAAIGDDGDDLVTGSFSPAMILHTGPGLSGLAWWWQASA